MNEKKKQGFATFFGRASLGRKLSAGFYWLNAVLLVVLLFVPLFSFDLDKSGPLHSEGSFSLLDCFIGGGKFSDLISKFNETMGVNVATPHVALILLLILYIVLILAIFICSLFTMNILSFCWTLSCILEVSLFYKLGVESLFKLDGARQSELTSSVQQALVEGSLLKMHSLYFWIFVAVIGVIAIVGLIFHFVLRGDTSEEDNGFYDDYSDDGRDMETGLAGPIATLKRLNTNEIFNILDNSEFLIGKNPEQVHIVITNSAVSRVHAKITSRNGNCVIEDMGSSNGTFMNDQRLIKGVEYPLKGNTYITLGNEILQFQENL